MPAINFDADEGFGYGAIVELKLLIRQKYTQSLEDVHGAGQQQNENPGGGD